MRSAISKISRIKANRQENIWRGRKNRNDSSNGGFIFAEPEVFSSFVFNDEWWKRSARTLVVDDRIILYLRLDVKTLGAIRVSLINESCY